MRTKTLYNRSESPGPKPIWRSDPVGRDADDLAGDWVEYCRELASARSGPSQSIATSGFWVIVALNDLRAGSVFMRCRWRLYFAGFSQVTEAMEGE